MKLSFLGGADEVGASCTLLEIAGHRIVVDCGIRMGVGVDPLPLMEKIQEAGGADVILLTHAHMDHSGALPVLVQRSPVPIYMTAPTLDLIGILLRDALNIMKMESKGDELLYSESDVELVFSLTQKIPWQTPQEILGGDVRVTYFPAGHILGASSILIESREGTVFVSGDIASTLQLTVTGLNWSGIPKGDIDLLITESTYGGRSHTRRRGEEQRLVETVSEVVERGGQLLIPAFALGRSQEVILILARAMEKALLPKVPLYVDGMVRKICSVYWNHSDWGSKWFKQRVESKGSPFYALDNIQAVGAPSDRERILVERPSIIVTSSGMLSGGPSQFYAQHLAGDPLSHIAITGYQDEESPGRAVQEVARRGGGSLILGEKSVDLICSVGTYSLSAHSDTSQIVKAIAALEPRQVCLVHGDQGAQKSLTHSLKQAGIRAIQRPSLGSTFEFQGRRAKGFEGPNKGLRKDSNASRPVRRRLEPQHFITLAQRLFDRDGGFPKYTVERLLKEWGDHPEALTEDDYTALHLSLRVEHSPFKNAKKGFYRVRFHPSGVVVGGIPSATSKEEECGGVTSSKERRRLEPHHFRALAQRLYDRDHGQRSYTPNFLLEEWGDEPKLMTSDGMRCFREALRAKHSPFKFAKKGRFRVRYNPSGEVMGGMPLVSQSPQTQGSWMDELPALEQIKAAIPLGTETGLYRIRVKAHSHRMILCFYFPKPSQKRWSQSILALEKATGWKILVHAKPHSQALEEAALRHLPMTPSKSPGIHLDQGLVEVKLPSDFDEKLMNEAADAFEKETGFVLKWESKKSKMEKFVPTSTTLEPSLAMACIHSSFMNEPHQPFKISFYPSGVELAFITPEIGARYQALIQQLSVEIGYPIQIKSYPNQALIIQLVENLVILHGGDLRKSPRLYHDQRLCLIHVKPPPQEAAQLTKNFYEKTGWTIQILR